MAQVLPKSCMKRVAMEAGVGAYWYQYVGLDGKVRRRGSEHTRAHTHTHSLSHTHTQILSVERFGMSAPGDIVFKELGMTADHLIKACKDYM